MKMFQVTDNNHFSCLIIADNADLAYEKGEQVYRGHVDLGEDDQVRLDVQEIRDGAILDNDGPVYFR